MRRFFEHSKHLIRLPLVSKIVIRGSGNKNANYFITESSDDFSGYKTTRNFGGVFAFVVVGWLNSSC